MTLPTCSCEENPFTSETIGSSTKAISATSEMFARTTEILVDKAWTRLDSIKALSETTDSSTRLDTSVFSSVCNPFEEIENRIIINLGYERFEEIDNIQNDINIYNIISTFGEYAILVISNLIDSNRVKFLQVVHLLSLIGEIRHMPTYLHRTWLLEKSLHAKSKYVRDGASLGILYLENPSTINSLKDAINRETNAQLKKNMIQELTSLEKIV